MQTANERWADMLAGWRVPPELETGVAVGFDVARFDVARFAAIADHAVTRDTPSRQRALEVLPEGGSVLDVGCGAGAGSLPLIPPARVVIGVDVQLGMLDAFVHRALARGAEVTAVLDRWPAARDRVPVVDVVVSHNLVYAMPDLATFATTLSQRARHRVVVQCSARHPLDWVRPFWRALHGIDRPDGPTVHDGIAAIQEAGIDVNVVHWTSPGSLPEEPVESQLAFLRARLRVGPDRDPELRSVLAQHPAPAERAITTLWWDVT